MFVLSTSQMALQAIIDKKHLVSTPDDQHDVSQEVINRVRVARLSMGLINVCICFMRAYLLIENEFTM